MRGFCATPSDRTIDESHYPTNSCFLSAWSMFASSCVGLTSSHEHTHLDCAWLVLPGTVQVNEGHYVCQSTRDHAAERKGALEALCRAFEGQIEEQRTTCDSVLCLDSTGSWTWNDRCALVNFPH